MKATISAEQGGDYAGDIVEVLADDYAAKGDEEFVEVKIGKDVIFVEKKFVKLSPSALEKAEKPVVESFEDYTKDEDEEYLKFSSGEEVSDEETDIDTDLDTVSDSGTEEVEDVEDIDMDLDSEESEEIDEPDSSTEELPKEPAEKLPSDVEPEDLSEPEAKVEPEKVSVPSGAKLRFMSYDELATDTPGENEEGVFGTHGASDLEILRSKLKKSLAELEEIRSEMKSSFTSSDTISSTIQSIRGMLDALKKDQMDILNRK